MESADKPGSVEDSHSSRAPVAERFKRPTRERCGPHHRSPIRPCSRWGLPCRECCHSRGALLPHHFTLTSSLARTSAVYFLWHFPWARAPQALPGTLPYGARTFLPAPSLLHTMPIGTAYRRLDARRLSGRLRAALYQVPTLSAAIGVINYVFGGAAFTTSARS